MSDKQKKKYDMNSPEAKALTDEGRYAATLLSVEKPPPRS